MYRIKYNDSTIFDPYDDDEVVTDAKLTQEVNAAAYMDFTISPKHPLYDTVKERDGVVTLYWMSNDDSEADEKLFEGVIDSISTDFYGYKSISCVSALDYLNDTIVRPYSTVAGEQSLTAPSSIEGYFQWLVNQHNAHVLDSKKRFGVGINQGANLRRSNFIYRSSTNNPTTSEEISNQIIESLGGYLVMRYDGENRLLDLYADVHEMNAQIIDFGVNLLDFTKTIDTADQYTALIPKGGSPTFEDGGFEDDDSVWTAYPYLNISTDQKHGGEKSAYFTEGNGEFINKSFLYVKSGYRYKATVWVRNERSSSVKVYPRYQVFVGSQWETRTPDGVNPLEVPNDNEWHEFTFDFLPSVSDTTKIRGCWVFDTVTNDNNKRVYVDDFNFVRIQGENELEEDPITVAQMGDGTTPFSYDIVKHGDVIYSMSAVQRYGYREKVFSDDTITDEDALMEEGIRQLNKCIEPTTGIDIKAVDLAMYMKGYTHLQVGQAVRIRSALHDTDEYLMVTSVNLDLQDPSQTEYELGMAYDSLTGKQSSYLQSLNVNINSSLDAVASIDQASKENAIHIGEVESIANDAQNTANNAQNTANSNKEAIDSIKDAQTEYDKQLEQMQQGVADATKEIGKVNERIEGMNSEIESAKSDIDSLRSSTETEFQNVKQSVSKVQSDVDAVTQKAEDLASDLDGTKATVEQVTTDLGEVKTTVSNAATKADQALQVSTSASQTATEAQTTATSAYQDAQSALTQSSTASQTANAVKTELETKYSTTDEIAEQYATKSLVEQTSQSITSTVEATYATKATVEALENIANNAVQTWMGSGVPTLSNKPASDWTTAELKSQHSGDIYYDSDTGYSYRFGSSDGKNYSWSLIKDTDISKAVADAAKAQQTAEGVSDEVTQLKTDIPATYATKTEVKQTTDSIKSTVSEVASTANSALSKATTVEQTANGLQTTVTEQAEKLDGAVTTISQVSQRVDSVSSTITQVQGDIAEAQKDADKAVSTANSALSQSSTVQQELTSFKTNVQQTYETKNDALSKQSSLQQSVNNLRTEVSETYITKDEAETTYSTKSYVDQTSRTVSLGVVEEYKNGQHGSALATQSDITAAKDSITSTVSQTYLSKNDASVQYATKTEVTQTSDALTVKIDSAASTADTAKTNAANAQLDATNANNRVGNIETCIKMTTQGVRVGKLSNGQFAGYSALVSSAGSFDILNASGDTSSRFSDSVIELGKNNDSATISMLQNIAMVTANTNGVNISSPKNVQLTAGDKDSGQTFMVKSDGVYYENRKIFPPFSVLEKQNYSDINIEAYSYAGFVSVNVRRWNQSGTAWFPPAQNRSIIGKINPDYAPKQGIDVLVGIHGNAWLEMSIQPNGDISIYELYSDSGVNVASFGGLANYLPKNALL